MRSGGGESTPLLDHDHLVLSLLRSLADLDIPR
jgi:hypothetical protein